MNDSIIWLGVFIGAYVMTLSTIAHRAVAAYERRTNALRSVGDDLIHHLRREELRRNVRA